MRILFIVEYAHEQGTYFRWHNMAISLQKKGHYITVFTVDWDRTTKNRVEYRDGIEYRILSATRGFGIFTPSTNPLTIIRRLLVTYPHCDIVHTFQPFPFSAYIGWFLRRSGRARAFFYDWDDLWIKGLYKGIPSRLTDKVAYSLINYSESYFPGKADVTTVCSGYLQDLAIKAGSPETALIYNGFWPYNTLGKQNARLQLGLQPDSLYVGFMGRTTSELNWCIEALAFVLQNNPQTTARLALCGTSTSELIGLPAELRHRIDYLGQLSPSDCKAFASALDFGLLPLSDTAFNRSRFPIKFADYQAAGTPVIYSEVGECHLVSRYLKWNIGTGTTKQQFITSLIDTLSKKSTLNSEEIDTDLLASNLSWESIGEKLENAYKSFLGSSKAGSLQNPISMHEK